MENIGECYHYSCRCLAVITRKICQERDLYKKALEKYAGRKNHATATDALIYGKQIWKSDIVPDPDPKKKKGAS